MPLVIESGTPELSVIFAPFVICHLSIISHWSYHTRQNFFIKQADVHLPQISLSVDTN